MQVASGLAFFLVPVALAFLGARHLVPRLLLVLLSLALIVFGIFLLEDSSLLETDAEREDTYALDASPGTHALTLTSLSQNSMEPLLVTSDGSAHDQRLLENGAVEAYDWKLEGAPSVSWYRFSRRDDGHPGALPLFLIHHQKLPETISLTYRVPKDKPDLLGTLQLVVRHDSSAKHMLMDHGASYLDTIAYLIIGWGGLWLLVAIWIFVKSALKQRTS